MTQRSVWGGTDYTIDSVFVDPIQLQINLGDDDLLGNAANDLVFHVGTQTYALADASYSSGQNAYVWYGNQPTWAVGDSVVGEDHRPLAAERLRLQDHLDGADDGGHNNSGYGRHRIRQGQGGKVT